MISLLAIISILFTNSGSESYIPPAKGKIIQTELYFGLSRQHGGMVTDEEWSSFADTVLSKIFINGMTILDCEGQWFDSAAGKRISEDTHLVIGVNEMTKKLSDQIDTARAKYCRYYDQASVLRIDQKVRMRY